MTNNEFFDSLEPVNRQATAAVIAQRIRDGITNGRFRAGDQLGEAQLAAALGVSRGPVREALQRLIQEGILRNEPNRGVFVEGLDLDEIRDIYFVRTLIEHAAVARLLERKDEEALEELERCCEEMRRAVKKRDVIGVSRWDLEFHKTLTVAAQSKRLTRMFETLLTETQLALTSGGRELQLGDTVIEEHRAILDALRAGDRRRSLSSVDKHMESGVRRRMDLVSESPP
ncbi:MAG TPA: GntR family transcriptional regulator [Actinomycetota bacterium]|jgi:DNA-binding GntR family transcriptional regulator|nr:GntR family transcriptional regulator [Actinomycetota bacterium]